MYKFYYYYSIVSCLLFCSASIIFLVKYNNIQGGIWAAAAACVAGISFFLHKLNADHTLQEYSKPGIINSLDIFSFIACLLGTVASVWYIFAIIYWKDTLTDYSTTSVFPCVFSFLTGKWGLHLKSSCDQYFKIVTSHSSSLYQSI